MENLWLTHWNNNNWVPKACASCIKWEPNESIYWQIRCNKWPLMEPNSYCDTDYKLDNTKTPEEVIDFVKKFIQINSTKIK